jgi:hypothetical protein
MSTKENIKVFGVDEIKTTLQRKSNTKRAYKS